MLHFYKGKNYKYRIELTIPMEKLYFPHEESHKNVFPVWDSATTLMCCRSPVQVVGVANGSLLFTTRVWQVFFCFKLSQVSFYKINCFLQCLLPGYFIALVYCVCVVCTCLRHKSQFSFYHVVWGTELISTLSGNTSVHQLSHFAGLYFLFWGIEDDKLETCKKTMVNTFSLFYYLFLFL